MVSIVLILLMVLANRALRSFDPLAKPTGLVLLSLIAVDTVDRLVLSDTNKKVAKNLGPYVGTLWGYLFLSCIWGLTGFDAPTGNYSVTLTMAIMTIFLVEYYSIKSNGIKNYIHGLFEPIFVFLPMNLVGKLSPIVSLSMRMFANILSGSLIKIGRGKSRGPPASPGISSRCFWRAAAEGRALPQRPPLLF